MKRFERALLAVGVLALVPLAGQAQVVGENLLMPPSRTVVPARPNSALPNQGVTWRSEAVALDPGTLPLQVYSSGGTVGMRLVVVVDGQEYPIEIPQPTVVAIIQALLSNASGELFAPQSGIAGQPSVGRPAAAIVSPQASSLQVPGQIPAGQVLPAEFLGGMQATIHPKMPSPGDGGVYRVQVGSFARPALAQACFDRLRSAGLDPRFERHEGDGRGPLWRVVLPGIAASEVQALAFMLGNAGFDSALVRREN
ncbi:MAG: SPOR domain-containing protein [Treponema sp.]|nr:SPOR domain-containing protein [Treponema sp.]